MAADRPIPQILLQGSSPRHRSCAFASWALGRRCNLPCQIGFRHIVFCSSKPKLPCSERTSPRTATIEEVTSTAQIAICTTSKRSRRVIRRPASTARPGFDDLIGIGAKYLPYRNGAKEESADQSHSNAIDKHLRPGSQARGHGPLGNGCHALSPRSSITLPRSPVRLRRAKSVRLR